MEGAGCGGSRLEPASKRTLRETRSVHMSGGSGTMQAPASLRCSSGGFKDGRQTPSVSLTVSPLSLGKHVAAPVLSARMHRPQPSAQYEPHGQSSDVLHSFSQ